MTCKFSEGDRKHNMTATSTMFPCSQHACIGSTMLSSWTSGLRCMSNWCKNQPSFRNTCIAMNDMATSCFSKTSTQTCNVCSLSVAMNNGKNPCTWEQWTCHLLQHHQTWSGDTSLIWEIPHMQSTTFNKGWAVAKHVNLFKYIIANPFPKRETWFFKTTLFEKCFVWFTTWNISKSPSMVSFFWSVVKNMQGEKTFKPCQMESLVRPTKLDKHTFRKRRLHKIYKACILWVSFSKKIYML